MGTQLVKSVCAREPNQEGSSCFPVGLFALLSHRDRGPPGQTKQTFPRNLETLKDRLTKQRTAARAACEGER